MNGAGQVAPQALLSVAVANLAPPMFTVYLRLRFLDPAGQERDFPVGFPVVARFGVDISPPGANTLQVGGQVEANGLLRYTAPVNPLWRTLTLYFAANELPYFICEPLGSPPRLAIYQTASGLEAAAARGERFFSLPLNWGLKHARWSPPPAFAGNGEYPDERNGLIRQTVAPERDIGTLAAPVRFVLYPFWKYQRFEFFDRYYGNMSPPAAGHHRRITIPPVVLEGFRADPNAAASPPDTRSNWTDGADPVRLQCLPWILRRNDAGADLSPPTGATMGLRFQTHQTLRSFVYSDSRDWREIRHLDAGSPPLRPGPDRLRYYDLPRVWKSRGYYTRGVTPSPPPGAFFQTLTTAQLNAADDQARPMVFCLDDMVLHQAAPPNYAAAAGPPAPAPLAAALAANDRLAIFNHRFDDTLPNCTPQGLYLPNSLTAPVDPLYVPYSDIAPPTDNYLSDYPDWTRLVIAQGSMFDVFDQRTPDSPPRVAGARAAVRWVDATAGLGVPVETPAGINMPNGPIRPGRRLAGSPPDRRDIPLSPPLFSMQPFWEQRTPTRFQPYNIAADERGGRFDIALLRCCDVVDNQETAVNLHYLRTFFDFHIIPVGSPPFLPAASRRRQFAQRLSQNVANRWSGNEPSPPGLNPNRAEFLPSPPNAVPIRIPMVWYLQHVERDWAHCAVDVRNVDRANRGTEYGDGETGPNEWQADAGRNLWFTSAHENGHVDSLPDEYNERWSGTSYDQLGLPQNLAGDPFEPDDGSLAGPAGGRRNSSIMNENRMVRNRHLWHAAEWASRIVGCDLKVKTDSFCDDYWLPHHALESRNYYTWPLVGMRDQPPVPARASADLFAYALGKDRYSMQVLPRATAADPFDGILVVAVRLHCRLPAPAAGGGAHPWATREDRRGRILAAIAAAVRGHMNNRWFVRGDVDFGAPLQRWHYRRCLLYFAPYYVVTNHPGDPATQGTANGQVATYPRHAEVRITRNIGAPVGAVWAAAAQLDINIHNWNADPGPAFIRRFPEMLGINKPPPPVGAPAGPGQVQAADWVPLVSFIVQAAQVFDL